MPDVLEPLDEMECRVSERYAAVAAARMPEMPDDPFDITDWFSTPEPTGPREMREPVPTLQFPRQQWVTWPNKRRITLLVIDRALDKSDQLTDEHWAQLTFLMFYGGREQIA